jgi:hypothetical protein
MNIFCAYAFTGEDLDVTNERMQLVVDTLNSNNHTAYCNLFDPVVVDIKNRGNDVKEIFAHAFAELSTRDTLIAIISSPNKSVGQIIEIGTALSQGKPVYVFEHVSAKGSTYLPALASYTYEWSDLASLQDALKNLR